MRLGIPRGFFYYDYLSFARQLFQGTDIELITGQESDEALLERGSRIAVDEACIPIKLLVGQVDRLCGDCDRVLVPRIMKDYTGRWLCPKLLGLPELLLGIPSSEKLVTTDPVYFDRKRKAGKSFWHMCRQLGMKRGPFEKNFTKAYENRKRIAEGTACFHVEAAWEFVPDLPGPGEILLPNTKRILLAGHCYTVYDRFINGNIMKKLDDLGIEAVTENTVSPKDREKAVESLHLLKKPFWESFVRVFGTALCLKDQLDGIVYLSSFSCGPDAFIIEMIRTYLKELPIMVLKLDEHRGEAGFDTRIEAFADLMERRRVS